MEFSARCQQMKKCGWELICGSWLELWRLKKSSMERSDPRELLIAVTTALETLNIPYLITGGMAVFVWGRPRFTADIDIVVELKREDVDKLETALTLLGEKGYIDKQVMQEALAHEGEFNFIDGVTGVKVDFWVLKKSAFDRSRLARRVKKVILNKTIFFSSPEDLLLAKLIWFKQSDSTKQREDIESILAVSGTQLDKPYIEEWVEKMELKEVWSKIAH